MIIGVLVGFFVNAARIEVGKLKLLLLLLTIDIGIDARIK